MTWSRPSCEHVRPRMLGAMLLQYCNSADKNGGTCCAETKCLPGLRPSHRRSERYHKSQNISSDKDVLSWSTFWQCSLGQRCIDHSFSLLLHRAEDLHDKGLHGTAGQVPLSNPSSADYSYLACADFMRQVQRGSTSYIHAPRRICYAILSITCEPHA